MGEVERLNAERARRGEELKRESISWLTGKNKIDLGVSAANEVSRLLVEFLRTWRVERESEPRLALSSLFVDETVSRLRNLAALRSAPPSAATDGLVAALDRFPCPDDPLIANAREDPTETSTHPDAADEVGAVDSGRRPRTTPDGQEAAPEFGRTRIDRASTIIDVASYVGAAALGGVIGNRTDASVLIAVRQLFGAVISRWHSRRGDTADLALTEDEARDVARAAVLVHGDGEYESVEALEATAREGGSWCVAVRAGSEELHAYVDAGDPAHARVLIVGDSSR